MTQVQGLASRGRFVGAALALAAFAHASTAQCDVFIETNGIVAIEVESAPAVSQWKAETQLGGYTGTSYYRWNGPNYFTNPGNAILEYRFKIVDGGNYRFRIHNRHNHPEPDQENDVWVRMDGGTWIKTYSNEGPNSVNKWVWDTTFEHSHNNHEPANFDLAPGEHVLQFSARSKNFIIDRFHLFPLGHPDGTNTSLPQSPCDDDGPYCVSKQNSAGCTPVIDTIGNGASATDPNPFRVVATSVINKRGGLLFYALQGGQVPFKGGFLCLAGPISRTQPQYSAGSQNGIDCTGTFDFDFNAFIQSGADPQLVPGQAVYTQYWSRDPGDVFKISLTGGQRFTILP